jgi:hypothetical protein
MDSLEKKFGRVEAKLRYMDADIAIITPGSFVTCAITGEEIPLIDLKYWNVDRQEAYADVDAATKAYLKYGNG